MRKLEGRLSSALVVLRAARDTFLGFCISKNRAVLYTTAARGTSGYDDNDAIIPAEVWDNLLFVSCE